jgi:hypothetical protein
MEEGLQQDHTQGPQDCSSGTAIGVLETPTGMSVGGGGRERSVLLERELLLEQQRGRRASCAEAGRRHIPTVGCHGVHRNF